MAKQGGIAIALVAPCGINCRTCTAYQRDKEPCPGCSGMDGPKSKYCVECRIKNCAELAKSRSKYCGLCSVYPCQRLKQLDKRYRIRYGMSPLENLERIKTVGIRAYVREEKKRWTCSGCGRILCVHRKACLHCGAPRMDALPVE